VAHFDAGFEPSSRPSTVKRRPSMVSMPPIKSSGLLHGMAEEKKDEPSYETFSKQDLLNEVEKVRLDEERRTGGAKRQAYTTTAQ